MEYSQPTPATSLSAPPALHWLSTVCPGLIPSTWRPGGLVGVVELRTQPLCVGSFKSMVSHFFLQYIWFVGECTNIIKVNNRKQKLCWNYIATFLFLTQHFSCTVDIVKLFTFNSVSVVLFKITSFYLYFHELFRYHLLINGLNSSDYTGDQWL